MVLKGESTVQKSVGGIRIVEASNLAFSSLLDEEEPVLKPFKIIFLGDLKGKASISMTSLVPEACPH